MAMWSLLGARNTTMVAWESFGKDWINDVVNELKINPKIITATMAISSTCLQSIMTTTLYLHGMAPLLVFV